MSRFVILCLVVAVSVSEGYAASIRNKRQVIPREFQNINIENYLKNERAVRFQLKCIIDDGPCDRIGKYLKVTIPELLVNQCANCDMAQRERAGKLVSHIQQNFPEEWERAVKKFQGGLVKAEDAAKLENVLGIKLAPNLVAEPTTPPATTPAAKAIEVPSTSEVPVSTSSAAPAPSSSSEAAPASSSAAPAATSEAAPVVAASSSTAPEAVMASSSAAPEATSTAAATSTSTSEATSSASPSSSEAPKA